MGVARSLRATLSLLLVLTSLVQTLRAEYESDVVTCSISCAKYAGDMGRRCDPSCLDDPPSYGGEGCNYNNLGAECRLCYNDIFMARQAALRGELALMCDGLIPQVPIIRNLDGEPSTPTATPTDPPSAPMEVAPTAAPEATSPPVYRRLRHTRSSWRSRRLDDEEDADGNSHNGDGIIDEKNVVVKPTVEDLCIFTRVFPTEAYRRLDEGEKSYVVKDMQMNFWNVAALSARKHLPDARVVVTVPLSQYAEAMALMDASLAKDAAVIVVPLSLERHLHSELWADEICGSGTQHVLYMPIGAVFTRTPEFLDVRRPLGDLLVSHVSYSKLPWEAQAWKHQNLALLGWPTPCFTHGQDVVLPVTVNGALRINMKESYGANFEAKLAEFGDAFNAVELLAGFAFGRQLDGVAFLDANEWGKNHIINAEESIWEIPLIKPPFSCRGDIKRHPNLLQELEKAADGEMHCPHGWIYSPQYDDFLLEE